jgi:LPS-assembly protein
MKAVLVAALATLSVAGWCQDPQPPPPEPTKVLPTQPARDPLKSRTGDLPTPDKQKADDPTLYLDRLDSGGVKNKILEAKGNVQFRYKGYQVFADEIYGDLRTNIFIARGNVRLFGAEANVSGDLINIDFDKRTFVAEDSNADVRGETVGKGFQGDVYLRGGRTYGSAQRVFGEQTSFTTCNREHPHFEIDANRVDFRTGQRVVLRDTRFKLFNRTILKLPYVAIPLNNPNVRYLPEVGRTDEVGYFVKARLGIRESAGQVLDGRLEYFTRLGLGLGLDQAYRSAVSQGFLRAYSLIGPRPLLDLNQDHTQKIGERATLTVSNSYQKTNFVNAPNNTLLTSRLSYNLRQDRATSGITLFRTQNRQNTFQNVNTSITAIDQRQWNPKLRSDLTLNYGSVDSQFQSGSPVTRQQFDVRFRLDQDLSRANLQFQYQRSIPIGENANFFGASDITPLVSITSDGKRLFNDRFKGLFDFRTELSGGQFRDPIGRGTINRYNFDIQMNHADTSTKPLQFNWNGRFVQGIYSDDTAQYVLNFNPALSYRFGQSSSAIVRWNYLKPYGYTPLQIDRVGSVNIVSGEVNADLGRGFSAGGQATYDIRLLEQGQKTAWQPAGVRLEYNPSQRFAFRTLANYDPTANAWSNIRFDLAWRPGQAFVSAGARYDGIRRQWAALNLFVDGLRLGKKSVLSSILSYNGYLRKFEATHFQFTYDLHCAELVATYINNPVGFRNGRQLQVMIRLKAFPFDSPFGIGQRGQGIGTGTGRG